MHEVKIKKYYVKVAGVKTCYIEAGEGFPVVFIHGWLGSSIDFPALFPFLAKRFRCLALDLPGFGETETFSEEPTLENYGKFIQHFVSALDLGEHSIIGNCFGASIAIDYILRSQDGVKKAVLFTPLFFSDILKKKWLPLIKLMQFGPVISFGSWLINTDIIMGTILRVFFRNRKRRYYLDAKLKKQQADHRNAAKVAKSLLNVEYRDRLKDIKIPTQVVVFESDGYLNTNLVITTANLLRDVRFHIVSGKGHLSNPDDLLEDYDKVSQFLS